MGEIDNKQVGKYMRHTCQVVVKALKKNKAEHAGREVAIFEGTAKLLEEVAFAQRWDEGLSHGRNWGRRMLLFV